MLSNIISALILGLAVYLLVTKNKKPANSLNDLINYKKIHSNGIVELEGFKYRMVLELEPINTDQMSYNEQKAVWVGFRDAINTLVIPVKFVIQSRYLDLKTYFNELQSINSNRNNEKLNEGSKDLADFYSLREKKNRDYKRYIILLFNAMDTEDLNSGVRINNDLLNSMFKSVKKGDKLSPDEYQTLAFNELNDCASVLEHSLGAIDITAARLDQVEVVDFLNYMLNRDMAPIATTWEADQKKMFSSIVNFSYTVEQGGGV